MNNSNKMVFSGGKRVFSGGPLSAVAALVLVVAMVFGYVANIVRLAHTDFASPYKEEVFRSIGIVVPFVGVILGFIPMDDTPN